MQIGSNVRWEVIACMRMYTHVYAWYTYGMACMKEYDDLPDTLIGLISTIIYDGL